MNKQTILDIDFMREALKEAEYAFNLDEVPVGAVVVANNSIIARGHNLRELTGDPTAHAEMIAIRKASEVRQCWRLTDMTLYVTLEPCSMCAGAIVQARIGRLVFGAYDSKSGAAGSLMNLVQDNRLNHQLEVTAGILEVDCGKILKDFFKSRR